MGNGRVISGTGDVQHLTRHTDASRARATQRGPPSRSLLPILSVAFVGSLGFSIVLPFLVFVVTRLGGNALVYGALGATYSAFQLVGAPILGRWSDRFGRRRVLLVSQLGTLAAWLVFLAALYLPVTVLLDVDTGVTGAFTLTLPLAVLFAARALDGLTGGNVAVANAYLADVTPPSERSVGFGRMAVASNLGFVLGPAIAGVLGGTALGEIPPVVAAIGVSVLASAIVLFGVRESTPGALGHRPDTGQLSAVLGHDNKECYALESPGVGIRDALRPGRIRVLLAIHFLVFLAFNLFYVSFPVHAATELGWTLGEVGIFFSAMGLMMAVVQGPVLAVAARWFGERGLVVVGSLILAAGFVLYTSADARTIYGGTALVALGNGLMWPSLQSMISLESGGRARGAVQGVASSSAALASIVGLLAGGVLYEVAGARIFELAGAITVVAALAALAVRLKRSCASTVSPASLRSAIRRRSRRRR